MTPGTARGLAAAALVVVLAGTAACGGGAGGGGESVQDRTSGPADTTVTGGKTNGTGTPTSGDVRAQASIFPGSESQAPSASAIKLPSTKVGEPTRGEVTIKGSEQGPPKTVQNVDGNIDGELLALLQKCLGPLPADGCDVIFTYTPQQPGPYSGELTVTMTDGSTVTAPISGEAVGADTTDTSAATTPDPETTTTTPPTTTAPPDVTTSPPVVTTSPPTPNLT